MDIMPLMDMRKCMWGKELWKGQNIFGQRWGLGEIRLPALRSVPRLGDGVGFLRNVRKGFHAKTPRRKGREGKGELGACDEVKPSKRTYRITIEPTGRLAPCR
jgi:hypothetical protein